MGGQQKKHQSTFLIMEEEAIHTLLKWATIKKKHILTFFKLYWLFDRDPYNGLVSSSYNWVV